MKNRHILLLGRSGTGKTTLLKYILENRHFPCLFILDVSDEYEGEETSIEHILTVLSTGQRPSYFYWRVFPDDEQDIRHLCRIILAIGHCTVVAEEMADYGNLPEFKRLLTRGRRQGIQVIGVSQRTADISKTITAQMAVTCHFYTDEPRDRLYIRQRWGIAAENEISTLDVSQFEYAIWGDEELLNEMLS